MKPTLSQNNQNQPCIFMRMFIIYCLFFSSNIVLGVGGGVKGVSWGSTFLSQTESIAAKLTRGRPLPFGDKSLHTGIPIRLRLRDTLDAHTPPPPPPPPPPPHTHTLSFDPLPTPAHSVTLGCPHSAALLQHLVVIHPQAAGKSCMCMPACS